MGFSGTTLLGEPGPGIREGDLEEHPKNKVCAYLLLAYPGWLPGGSSREQWLSV